MTSRINWPDGKSFAFTVFDDTDSSTLENVKEVYTFLRDCGFRTTKSVWPTGGNKVSRCNGDTCDQAPYLSWVKSLQSEDFEIAYHMTTCDSSLRDETIQGLEIFTKHFGSYPKSMANHDRCRENMYWGDYRLSGVKAVLYNLVTRNHNKKVFKGHIKGDPYFWGDICRDKIKYVRNFVFPIINTLEACPFMPYHDPERPYVNYWFASSNGHKIKEFNDCLSEENQDRLEAEGGACIMYTHFAHGFYREGKINPRFRSLIERLSKRNGWYVPVGTLLDYLVEVNGHHDITRGERNRLERRWLLSKMKFGKL